MLITKDKFNQIASNLLDFLDKESIKDISDLEELIDKEFQINVETKEFIEIALRPSNLGTLAHTISYIWPGAGIPIEARINLDLDYSQIIVKLDKIELPGYNKCATDPFGNTIHYKIIHQASLDAIKSELQNLSKQ